MILFADADGASNFADYDLLSKHCGENGRNNFNSRLCDRF